MNEAKISIAIADDHHIVRVSLSEYIVKHVYADVTVLASNGRELLEKIEEYPVDIILLDINMPVMDGIETLTELKKRNPRIKVIVLTMYDNEGLMLKLIKLKVNGFILKDGDPSELVRAVKEVYKIGYYFNQEISHLMYMRTSKQSKLQNYGTSAFFKPDELDKSILKLICLEKTSQQIGDKLSVSKRTIEGRKFKMMKTLNVKNNIGLAICAIKNGYVKL